MVHLSSKIVVMFKILKELGEDPKRWKYWTHRRDVR